MPALRIDKRPELENPLLITAFAGWNDASEVATGAAKFLVERWDAEKIADVDPEDFFVFSEQRPQVYIAEGAQRKIEWPSNTFYAHQGGEGQRDAIIFVGTEPNLRWRTFVDTVLGHATSLGAELVVSLGGLLADVPHSRAPRLTGSATDPRLAEKLGRLNVRSSRYEGPTGIVGVMGQECRKRGLQQVSIWGNVPHYINTAPNPKVQAAMLRRLDSLFDFELDLSELDDEAKRFDEQIADAVSRDPEAQAYVRQLEERDEGGAELEPDMPAAPERELPSGEEVVRELEEFLKRQNPEQGRG